MALDVAMIHGKMDVYEVLCTATSPSVKKAEMNSSGVDHQGVEKV